MAATGAFLLSDRDIEALNAGPFLIDDGVDGDGGLAGFAVACDEASSRWLQASMGISSVFIALMPV